MCVCMCMCVCVYAYVHAVRFKRDLSAMFAHHAARGRDGDRADSAEHILVLGQCPSYQSLSASWC